MTVGRVPAEQRRGMTQRRSNRTALAALIAAVVMIGACSGGDAAESQTEETADSAAAQDALAR